ncbi:hypothetical protein [Snodgrassella sp. ESL0253]|uniref:hypothetical protein n=1 Tax=Snodgrassella sp. ESL0253 TaxID=2705031 RepID=UPI00158235BC|nr:hypothetical protein [Snodgrassella sp. ESL0253]NUE66713.1 tail fiber assembly protein [Snodgrassella sp. ESL0253]
MKIYSYNEQTNELLVNTLRAADYIDAATISIPFNSVIADAELPAKVKKQVFMVTGKRNTDGYFTVSQNIATVEDYRSEKVYLKETGEQVTITEIGVLPDNVTTLSPIPYSEWSEETGKWVEKSNVDELRLWDKRKDAGILSRSQILTEIELQHGKSKDKLVEIAERELIGAHLIKVRNTILEAQTFTLANDDIWQFFTETLNIDQDRLFRLWEEAKKNY